jgi:hypothetical protein
MATDLKLRSKNLISTLILISLILTTIIVFSQLVKLPLNKPWVLIFLAITYFVLLKSLDLLYEKYPNIVLKYTIIVIGLPLFTLAFIDPFNKVALNILYYSLASAFIPMFLFIVLSYSTTITYETNIFIFLTLTSIIAVLGNSIILTFINKYSPQIHKDSVRKDHVATKELINSTLQQKNINLAIYLLYFIYLCIFSYYYIEQQTIFKTNKFN